MSVRIGKRKGFFRIGTTEKLPAMREVIDGTLKIGDLTEFTLNVSDIGDSALSNASRNCHSLISVDLSNLTKISGDYGMQYAFTGCTNLTSVDLSSLTEITGTSGMSYTFDNCDNLTSIDLSNLTTIGNYAMDSAFWGCNNLTSIDLSSLTTIGSYGMYYAFGACSSLKELKFPSLTVDSFGSYTNQFSRMLSSCKDCVVHFPASIESKIGSWSDVKDKFGGTSIRVLFDL